MIYIAPSLLAADFAHLATDMNRIERAGANFLHLDVMDGAFVPNISFGAPVIASLRKHSRLIFDVHLMIEKPMRYINDFIKAGADLITIHLESCQNVEEVLRYIRSRDVRCGLAISPATPVEDVIPYLPMVDMVLIMTVVPGFGGQALIPETLDKVRVVRRYVETQGLRTSIEVDGGIKPDNVALATEAGANILVAGSAIFGAKSPRRVIDEMRKAAAEHPYSDH